MTTLKCVAFLFGATGSNKWRAMLGSHLQEPRPGDRLLACFLSSVIGNISCRYQRALVPEKCPLCFLIPDSSYSIWTSLVRLGVLQITWKLFGGHVGNGDVARKGRSWILLEKEIWYLCCWFWSTKEPVSVPGVPKNQVVFWIFGSSEWTQLPPCLLQVKGTVWSGQRPPTHILQRTQSCV